MAGKLTSECAKELAAKGVAARRAKALSAQQEAPDVLDTDTDEDIVWAYRQFKSNPLKAPTDGKAFWLKIAQKNPEAFYRDHFYEANDRQYERRCKEACRRENPNVDIEEAYEKGYCEGYSYCEFEIPNRYEGDEDGDDDGKDFWDQEDEEGEEPEEQEEASPRIVEEKAPARRNGRKPSSAPKQAALVPVPVATPKAPAAPPPPAPEVVQALEPEPKPREPILCDRCRLFGYPRCQDCELANDPGLERSIEGFLLRTKPSTPIDPRYPWFRRLGYH
jgi:hypothetical protein